MMVVVSGRIRTMPASSAPPFPAASRVLPQPVCVCVSVWTVIAFMALKIRSPRPEQTKPRRRQNLLTAELLELFVALVFIGRGMLAMRFLRRRFPFC